MKNEYIILGTFDVDDRPNVEVIYFDKNEINANHVYSLLLETFYPDTTVERIEEIQQILINKYGIADDVWDKNLNFSPGKFLKTQEVF